MLASKSPFLLDFHEDLVSLEAASKVIIPFLLFFFLVLKSQILFLTCLISNLVAIQIQLKSLAEEMQAIIKGLEKVEQELAASENDGPVSDGFCKVSPVFQPCNFGTSEHHHQPNEMLRNSVQTPFRFGL